MNPSSFGKLQESRRKPLAEAHHWQPYPHFTKPTVESSGIGHRWRGATPDPHDSHLQAQASVGALGFFHVDLSPPFQALTMVLDHLKAAGSWMANESMRHGFRKYLYRYCLKTASRPIEKGPSSLARYF